MGNISDYETDIELEYIEPIGSCHKDIYEDGKYDCRDYMECEECPYWY